MTALLTTEPHGTDRRLDRGPEGIEARVIAATLACIARHGLSKTTIDDVAREAGCSRATLYRYFGSKQDLVTRVVQAEAGRVTEACRSVAADAATLEDAVVGILLVAGRELATNRSLRFVADHEPEILLPHLTFSGGDRFLHDASHALAPCLAPWLGDRATRGAEWMTRLALSLWFSPSAPVSLDDPVAVRAYAREFIVAAIQPHPQLVASAGPSSAGRSSKEG